MTFELCFPLDEASGDRIDFNRLADFLELAAFLASDGIALASDLANQAVIGAAEDYADLDEEMRNGAEGIVSGSVRVIEARRRALEAAYPFALDDTGGILTYAPATTSFGQAAYILSLVLSNLRSMSSILVDSRGHPEDAEIPKLRRYFQYFATAGMAAEIQGPAWSFGFPRPDGTGFIPKLRQIWEALGDGEVGAQAGAPQDPKDDGIDVLAARPHADRLPGFLLAAAQVATGKDAREKSLTGRLDAFKSRWFSPSPVSRFIPYMIVPFARGRDEFIDDVRVMGNVLHRLRLPRRVMEAQRLVDAHTTVEGYDRLDEVVSWIRSYRGRTGRAP